MGLPTSYLGETDSKRVARLHTFKRVAATLKYLPLPQGRVITLAGKNPGDIGCFRDLLKIAPERVLYVENDPDHRIGLKRAKQRWPGVETYYGDVRDVLRSGKETISLFNADFMGMLKEKDRSIFQLAAHRMVKGSVLAYTFYRGREMEGKGMYGHLLARRSDQTGDDSRDSARFHLYGSTVQSLLGGPAFKVISSVKYDARDPGKHSRHSPMGTIGFRRMPSQSHEVEVLEVTDQNSWSRLVDCVLNLIWKGLSTAKIASILNITEESVAAFRAHNTRGTYNHKQGA
jgi:hypothetical protein